MRKLCLLLAMLLLVACLASCDGDKAPTPQNTVTATETVTKAPEKETDPPANETEPPEKETEAPQDKWTERY